MLCRISAVLLIEILIHIDANLTHSHTILHRNLLVPHTVFLYSRWGKEFNLEDVDDVPVSVLLTLRAFLLSLCRVNLQKEP